MEKKPFIFGVAVSGEHFTGREAEIRRLKSNFEHGINTILISPRRWGKTSLVKEVSLMVESSALRMVYFDTFACRNEREFYSEFATAVIRQTSSRFEEWIEAARNFLSRLSPKINFGPDPMTDFSLSLDLGEDEKSGEEVLSLPQKIAAKKGIDIVVCIDEFQQISDFPDSVSFQKRLRSVWQHQKNVSYCLFGSKRHLMAGLFDSQSMPFYKFGDMIHLTKIPVDVWQRYIQERFSVSGKLISEYLADRIAQAVDCHPNYVQQLAWLIWVNADTEADDASFDVGMQDLLDQNTPLFESQTESLTLLQLNMLRAIIDGRGKDLTKGKTIVDYELRSSATVVAVKDALIRKELIMPGREGMEFLDPVFKIWLKRNVL